ncbi:MAG: hypothetical protein JW983_09040 [Elusimicrobia bacterium]|nr:hypothetical protein [Elusimicrobiota bacterium]
MIAAIKFIIKSLVVLAYLLFTVNSYSYNLQSTNYHVTGGLISSGGEKSLNSTNYRINTTIDGPASITNLSTNYKIFPGYQSQPYRPGTITNLYVSSGTNAEEINIVWTSPGADGTVGSASSYVVKYATYSINSQSLFDLASTYDQNWTPATPPGSNEEKTLTGLNEETTFYIAIEARDSARNQAYFSTGTILSAWTQTTGKPNEPSGFTGTVLSTSSILWEWTDEATNESGYYLCTSTNGRITTDLGVDKSSYTETGLEINTQYTRCAEVYNSTGSKYSDSYSRYTFATAPSNLQAVSVYDSSVTFSWDSGICSSYGLAGAKDSDFTVEHTTFIAFADNLTVLTTTVYNLSENTLYYFRVWGYNGDGVETGYTDSVSANTIDVSFPGITYNKPLDENNDPISKIGVLGNKMSIEITVTDNRKVTGATLYYRKIGETSYNNSSFSLSGNTLVSKTGTADISKEFVENSLSSNGFEYYITATDSVNVSTYPTAFPRTITVSRATSKSVSDGTVSLFDGNPEDGETGVNIPAGALDFAVPITITQENAAAEAPAVDEQIDITKNNGRPVAVFDFGPDGTQFKKPVSLTLVYFDHDPKDGFVDGTNIDESTLGVYFWDGSKWRIVGGNVDKDKNTITASVYHFSKYALFPASTRLESDIRFLTRYTPARFGASAYRVIIYDVTGRIVIELDKNQFGENIIQWDGEDENNIPVESGFYIYKVEDEAGEIVYGSIVIAR